MDASVRELARVVEKRVCVVVAWNMKQIPTGEPSVVYSTFWQRLGALCLDFLCNVPFVLLFFVLNGLGRYGYVGGAALSALVNAGFYVFLVARFGGTPGKLMMGLRIVKIDGSPAGYREATLRNAVEWSLSALSGLALSIGALGMTDADYASLGWQSRIVVQVGQAPAWYPWVSGLLRLWAVGLLVVMLANSKRRSTHDFLAGTVVVKPLRDEPTTLADTTM